MSKLTVLIIAFRCASAFLIQDFKYNQTASQSSIGQHTSVEDSIRDLMTLITDEKRIRFQLENRLKTAEDKIDKMDQYNIAVSNELEREKNKVNQLEIMLIQMQNISLKSVQGESVGFTVNNPNTSAGSDPLKFINEEYNNQSAYNMTSGKFVCKKAGLYYFTFSILKSTGSASVYCHFNKNGKINSLTYTYANGASDIHVSATNSILYQLYKGDNVFISTCTGLNYLNVETSFTGFLVSPTN